MKKQLKTNNFRIQETQIDNLIAIIKQVKSPSQFQSKNSTQIIVQSKKLSKFGQQQNLNNNKKIAIKKANFYQYLTKTVIFCSFINLKQLYINDTQLNNVEWVSFLDAPKLKILILANNKITNFKPFIKLRLTKFSIMNIQQNYSPQINFQRMQLSNHVSSLIFQNISNDRVKIQDLSKLAKYNSQFIQRIKVWQLSRIKQKKIIQKITQKFFIKDVNSGYIDSIDITDEYYFNTD